MTVNSISVWVPGDQLLVRHYALEAAVRRVRHENVVVVLVESRQIARRFPYHRKKLVFIYSAMRHYAERLRSDGYKVDYRFSETIVDGLLAHIREYAPECLLTMAASDYQGRLYQHRLPDSLNLPVEVLPNTQFLVSEFDPYPNPEANKRYTMEYFYRAMRVHFAVLMDGDSPVGGRWNFDKENRKSLPKDVPLPDLPKFGMDEITEQVMDEIRDRPVAIGEVTGFNYAVTHEQAEIALKEFVQTRLFDFGAYEDAMASRHHTLFHAVLSPYVNVGLLTPMQMIRAAEHAYYDGVAPINSVEGFVRQVLGWREFMYWQYWRMMPELSKQNEWQAQLGVPGFFWTGQTDMNCLHHMITNALDTAYSHHIERLMLASNFAVIAGINPQEMLRWFRSIYIDAYDWVMQPNVIGMGLNADGGQIATKPYIASANYINKMSDYCKPCKFNPKSRTGEDACPFNLLYWNFLLENEAKLRANPRSGRSVLGLRHLDERERIQIRRETQAFLAELEKD